MGFCGDGKEIAKGTAACDRDRELRHSVLAARADAPDLVAGELGEPEAAIGPYRDVVRLVAGVLGEPEAAGSCRDVVGPAAGRRDRVFGDGARWGDAPDLVGIDLGEPEVAVGSCRDVMGNAARRGEIG